MDSDESENEEAKPKPKLTLSCEFKKPYFDVSSWNPVGPAGIQYMALVPFVQTQIGGSQSSQAGKMKTSTAHRKQRMKDFHTGSTTCRNIVDERKLRVACNDNDYIAVIELLDGGTDPSCEDDKKRTPLHIAASQGHETIVRVLLDKGADPNKKDFIGNTPLHLAACTCQIPVITLLLRAGTDVKSADLYGRTPLKLAKSRLERLIGESRTCESKLNEMKQVSEMMSAYLRISGQLDDANQLDDLCLQLQKTTTREEVDHMNALLSDFASMNIQKSANYR